MYFIYDVGLDSKFCENNPEKCYNCIINLCILLGFLSLIIAISVYYYYDVMDNKPAKLVVMLSSGAVVNNWVAAYIIKQGKLLTMEAIKRENEKSHSN